MVKEEENLFVRQLPMKHTIQILVKNFL